MIFIQHFANQSLKKQNTAFGLIYFFSFFIIFRVLYFKCVLLFIFYIKMLKERTSSATQLRIESSLRHSIRNLRAKVRSILPQQLCIRQVKRNQSTLFHEFSQEHKKISHALRVEINKNMNKEFDKLTLQELEEIGSNKHYFLGSNKAIEYYEQYIEETHPELKSKQFAAPSPPNPKEDLTLSFVPFNLIVRKETPGRQSRQSCSSFQKLLEKRASTAIKRGSTTSSTPNPSCHQRKQSLVQTQSIKGDFTGQNYRQKYLLNQARKEDVQQYQKVKKDICYGYWQKQIQVATSSKQNFIQEKVDVVRFRHSAKRFQSNKQKAEKKKLEEYQVASLTSKLRKICLKKKDQSDKLQFQ